MLTLSIPAISCSHCARAIADTVHALDPGAVIKVDVDSKTAVIHTSADSDAVRARLAAEGYPPAPQ